MIELISIIFVIIMFIEISVTGMLMGKWHTYEEYEKDPSLRKFDQAFVYGVVVIPLILTILYYCSVVILCFGGAC